MKYKLYLASNSPRRKQILNQAGLNFKLLKIKEVKEVNHYNKKISLKTAEKTALKNSLNKAQVAADILKNGFLLTADTIVFFNNKILAKPADKKSAKKMLLLLSDNYHYVITGVAIILKKNDNIITEKVFTSKTKVYFRKLNLNEINSYLLTNEYQDKAGSYGIQGKAAAFVKKINGCYYNVVGLPIAKVIEALQEMKKYIITN